MDEYIILNKTAIQKRIAQIENAIPNFVLPEQQGVVDLLNQEIEIKKKLLSNSTPLIPEIEKAFLAGQDEDGYNHVYNITDYLKDLKLNL